MKRYILIVFLCCLHGLVHANDPQSYQAETNNSITNAIRTQPVSGLSAVTLDIENQVMQGVISKNNSADQRASFAMDQVKRDIAIDNYQKANGGTREEAAAAVDKSFSKTDSGPVVVYVTEKIPGAKCDCVVDGNFTPGDDDGNANPAVYREENCGNPQTRKYKCTVQKGMTSFQNMIRDITKWFVYIIMLLGVLALVGAGILWAMGSDSEEYTKKAKGWAKNIIIGLVLLFTFRYILGFLAPWIFQ